MAVGSAETEFKQLETKISHCEKELKENTNKLLSKREEAVAVETELRARVKDVENLRVALNSLPYKEGQMEALQKVVEILFDNFSSIIYVSFCLIHL